MTDGFFFFLDRNTTSHSRRVTHADLLRRSMLTSFWWPRVHLASALPGTIQELLFINCMIWLVKEYQTSWMHTLGHWKWTSKLPSRTGSLSLKACTGACSDFVCFRGLHGEESGSVPRVRLMSFTRNQLFALLLIPTLLTLLSVSRWGGR